MEIGHRIRVIQGDITLQKVDAIVNAANGQLKGGGGVDGAIHQAAGPELLKACQEIGACPVGEARMTPGYDLAAKHVIHAVGPQWNGGDRNEARFLANAYRNSLELARQKGLQSVAFPSISTGSYRFPLPIAARVAMKTMKSFLSTSEHPKEILMVCIDAKTQEVFQSALDNEDSE